MSNRAAIRAEQERIDAEAKAKRDALEKQLQETIAANAAALAEQLIEQAEDAELSPQTYAEKYILPRLSGKRASKAVAKPADSSSPKYQNPYDMTQSWSGKGPAPKWFVRACGEYKRESLREGRTPVYLPVELSNVPGTDVAAH